MVELLWNFKFSYFGKSDTEIQVSLKSDKIASALFEDLCILKFISVLILK
jgi:hypothetical protein